MLPGRVQPSTFGTERLNFCVRDGNRWDPLVIATGNGELFNCVEWRNKIVLSFPRFSPHPDNCTAMILTDRFQLVSLGLCVKSSPRPISIIKLHPLPNFHR